MNPTEVLTKAWEAVKASGVPEPLYEIAFREAMVLVSAASTPPRHAPKLDPGRTGGNPGDEAEETNSLVDADALMRRFSEESGVELADLIDVFYFDADGTPHLNVSARKLGDSVAAKAKAISTAIAAAHFYAADEPQVSVEAVRAEVIRLKSYDNKNFTTHLGAAPGTVLSGSGSSRVLRIKGAEMEAALKSVVNSARRMRE